MSDRLTEYKSRIVVPPEPQEDIQFWLEFAVEFGDRNMEDVLLINGINYAEHTPWKVGLIKEQDKRWVYTFPDVAIAMWFDVNDRLVEITPHSDDMTYTPYEEDE